MFASINRSFRVCAVLALLLAAGCVSTERVDRDVYREIARATAREPTITSNTAHAAGDALQTPPATVTNSLLSLNRDSALQLAARYSRELQDKRDRLYADALTLFAARREFEMVYSGTAEYVFNRDKSDRTSQTEALTLGAKRVLPTGATVKFTPAISATGTTGSNSVKYAKSIGAEIVQPLLAGAGYEASHAPLIQAERDYIYSLRAFALERQDYAIGIVRDFFDLVQEKSIVSNLTLTLNQFAYLRARSEAFFSVRRAPAIDVMRAQQQEMSATNQLSTANATYEIQKAQFLVELGLPESQPARVDEAIPSLHPVIEDQKRAIDLALARRPDVMTVRDKITDGERELRVAKNLYGPQVDLFGKGDVNGDSDDIGHMDRKTTASAGITAEIPFDRRGRRDAVRLAAIKLEGAQRAWQQKQANVALEVAASYSQLRSLANSVEIQRKNKEIAERRADNASFLFKEGELSNRDVVEAQTELLNARNGYVTALLDYEVQRLKLLRNIGLLDVGPDGELIELTP